MLHQEINEVVKDIAKQTEDLLMEQLNELVSRGLIVIEQGPMTLIEEARQPFTSPPGHRIRLCQTVRLVLKDQEYIEALEHRNKELEKLLEEIKAIPMGRVCK